MTLKKMVYNTLQNIPEARNNDINLMITIWKKYYWKYFFYNNSNLSINVADIYSLPTQDNIKRIRSEIQNQEHLFLPTSLEVAKKRKMLEQTWFEDSFNKFNNI